MYHAVRKVDLRPNIIRAARALAWRAFSVPIYVKILGIGFLVTMLFGAVTFYQVRVGVYRTHYEVYGKTALSLASSLATRLDVLTAREQEVCRLLAYGFTNAEVAEKLFISDRTVETHRTNIMSKLDLRSRAELVRFAIDNGLLKTD